jgi:hypothetical protein
MTGLICSFPQWSPEAVITEAARNWNLRHPGQPFDPKGGDWAFTRVVIDSWLRHAVSNYDAICHPENRLALRQEIQQRARRAYPWLSRPADPRSSGGGDARAQPIVRPLDQISGFLAELSAQRSAALLALQDARRKNERQAVQTLAAEIAEADRLMQALYRVVKPDAGGERDLFIEHGHGDYYWGGNRLSPNHIEITPLTCAKCKARIYRTKQAVKVGGGCRCFVLSCHCRVAFEARKWSLTRYADADGRLIKLPRALPLKLTPN